MRESHHMGITWYKLTTISSRVCGCHPSQVTSRLLNNYGGRMPLHCAVINGDLKIVKHLVEAGADIDGQDEKNMTPLQYCQGEGGIAGKR